MAEERWKSFTGEIQYKVFQLLKKGQDYQGLVKVTFELSKIENVFIDYSGKSIKSVKINDLVLNDEQIKLNWIDGFLQLGQFVKQGSNVLHISYQSQYNTDGDGLQSTINSQNKQYLYCQTEPYSQNRIFPCFDQPDMKAKLQYHFVCDQEWEVVSNTYLEKQFSLEKTDQKNFSSDFEKEIFEKFSKEFNANQKFIKFQETQKLSTYLFCFVAGEYVFQEYIDKDKELNFPLKIYYDKELQEYIDDQKDYIFSYIVNALKFYKKFFQIDAPWGKYDTVICPEFTVGAMEYPGVITYSDQLVFRVKKPTPNQVSRMGHVIVHELAHMWFGNLVTMKWWNDLWLNESFADFMCYLCQSFIDKDIPRETSDAWCNMCIRKNWGYDEDQSVTTHPIACEVENTTVANSIFDGITYSKGAAVLKQLYHLIGYETMSKCLKSYFDKYQFSNATLHDFLQEIQKGVPSNNNQAYDMTLFNSLWVEKEGPNILSLDWEQLGNNKMKLIIRQSNYHQNLKTLRFHKIKIALFDLNGKVHYKLDYVVKNQAENTLEVDNLNFSAGLLNYEDQSFVMNQFNQKSLDFFLNNLSKIEDCLTQLLIVRSFYDMIKNGTLMATSFIEQILRQSILLKTSNNVLLLQFYIDTLLSCFQFMPSVYRKEYKDLCFKNIAEIQEKNTDTSVQQILNSALISLASSYYSINYLYEQYNSKENNAFTLEQKWKVVYLVCASDVFTDVQKQALVEQLKQQDQSQLNTLYMTSIDALSKDEQKQQEIFNEYFSIDRKMSHTKIAYSITGFFNSLNVTYQKEKYIAQFFEKLPQVMNEHPLQIGRVLLLNGIPDYIGLKKQVKYLEKVKSQVKPEIKFHLRNIDKKLDQLSKRLYVLSQYNV